jgi:hypothetical protein
MEALRSSETSVPARAMQRHLPEDGILHSCRRENLTSYPKRLSFQTLDFSRVMFPCGI